MEVIFWVLVVVWATGALAVLVPYSPAGLWAVVEMVPTAAFWPVWAVERWVEGRHYGGS